MATTIFFVIILGHILFIDYVAASPIYLLGLYPMTGDWAGGQAMLPASQMAVIDVNANVSLLADYELIIIVTDTQCLGGTGTDVMYRELYDKKTTKTIILGGGCSVATIPTAEASKHWNLIQLSFSAYHPSLSDRSLYPLFFRMAPGAVSQNLVMVEIIKYFGWKRVATINPDDAAYYNVGLYYASSMKQSILESRFRVTNNISKKSNSTLGFLRRNLRKFPPKVNEQAYKTYVRPTLEFASSVWDPHTKDMVSQLDMVQRHAARFVESDYHPRHSVTQMLATLDFRLQAKANGIDVVVSESFENDPTIHIANIKRQNARIIIGNFWEQDAIKVMCAAYKEGLYGRKYVWILPGWFPQKWWHADNDKVNCSITELDKVVEGYLAAELLALAGGDSTTRVSNMNADEYSARYNSFVSNTQESLVGLDHGPYGYDAVWAVALALEKADKILKEMDPPSSLLDFNYTNDNMTRLFYDQFSATDFEGISGKVQFTNTGDRLGPMRLKQVQNNQTPADSFTHVEEFQVISVLLFSGITVCTVCGILLAIAFLAFNLAFSDRRIIKMSSPRLNNLILFGGIIVYWSIIFLGLDVNLLSLYQYEIISKCFTWCFVIGFSLGFGAMFSKTWRVHRIFAQKKPTPLRIRDSQLVGQVAAVVGLDLAILVLWEICDPRRASTYKGIIKPDPEDDDNIITEIYTQNVSRYQLYWIGALFIINGLLLIFGAFLAWETRNITMAALNDSKHIGMSVYTVVVMSFTGVPVSFVVEEPNSNYALLSCFIFFSTTVTLCLVFVPKIKMRNEVHPGGTMATGTTHSENVTQNK
ncbi:gamma-aminobutyric acid type B receptor subunit 2-like [Amphiura filiformis]|uniref:gamma-aminobutyric acid type B receptor subunit 2-like n=1 Tax=Amphiura filiformis TaxID=82378 RepID=UPI003B2254CF